MGSGSTFTQRNIANMRFNVFNVEKSKTVAFSISPEKLKRKRITFSESENDDLDAAAESARRKRTTWAKAIHGKGVYDATKEFFKKLPFRLWQDYIAAFLVPHYRPEWGKYSIWDARKCHRKAKECTKRHSATDSSCTNCKSTSQKNRHCRRKQRHVTDRPPRPVDHDHSECTTIRINVSGQIFEPQLRTLKKFPKTLLGNPERMVQFYDPERNEFFFDRHRSSFETIIFYYLSGGILRRPTSVALEIFLDEVKFFDLGPDVVSSLAKYVDTHDDDSRVLPKKLLQRKLWLLFEYPESSYQSRIVAYISILVVCMSIFEFLIETLPTFAVAKISQVTSEEEMELGSGGDDETLDIADPFFLTETLCIIFFVVEYVARAATCPHFFNFLKDFSNLIDLIAIMPYFLNVLYYIDDAISGHVSREGAEGKAISLTVFRIIRLVRVFRILKLSRHNRGLKILGKTLRASSRELGLLMFFLMIGVVLFSSAMFFAESQYENTPFTSIPQGFWFGVVTMTTLGYGDVVPVGPYGKIIGALCAISGVLTISLPVPVIVSNFNMFYSTEELSNSQAKASTNFPVECDHVEHCPYYPGNYNNNGEVLGNKMDNCEAASTVDGKSVCSRWLLGELREDSSDTDFDELLVENANLRHRSNRKMKIGSKSKHKRKK